jgi:pimeloyl-ACP methyl ester carboxylesterase
MSFHFIDHMLDVNGITLHAIEYRNEHPPLLLLHGLTANAHAFHGLISAGLATHFSVLSIDQRGRGLSTKTAFAYSIRNHAEDVIALLDTLQIDTISICGHSFGGLMATYLAWQYPERFDRIIILDAAPEMNPNTPQMLAPALSRIDHRYPDFIHFIEEVKKAPYLNFWDDAMLVYYQADVKTAEDGSVEPRSNIADIVQIATHVSKENWHTYFTEMQQPSLLIVATDDYTLEQPLLPTMLAKKIYREMKQCTYVEVLGNHQTMLFGAGANQIIYALVHFFSSVPHSNSND